MGNFLLNNFLNSLNNHVKSFSLRKEIALLFSLLTAGLDIVFFCKVSDPYYLLLGICANFVFILLILGIITLEQINKFKNGIATKDTINEIVEPTITENTETNKPAEDI